MNKKNFGERLASMQEAGEILHNSKRASRTWSVVEDQRIQTKEDVQSLRQKFGASQSAFAKFMGVSVNTLQNWEQGRRQPTGAARVLLTIAYRRPALFRETLKENCPELVRS